MFELKRIGIVKRASAWLLDVILLAVLSTGFMFVISLICNYSEAEKLSNEYYAAWEDYRKEYVPGVAEYYGFTYRETEDGYTIEKDGQTSSLGAVMEKLDASKGEDEGTKVAYAAYRELPPVGKVNAQYRYVYTLLFMMICIGVLLAYILLEFVIPLLLKNGQTVGKKVFGICLVRQDCVKVSPPALFARTVIGKYAIETMFPVLLVFLFLFGGIGILAVILIAALFILNAVLFFATKNRTPIHDVLCGTVAADMSVQVIFQTEEELIEKKKELHKSQVESTDSAVDKLPFPDRLTIKNKTEDKE